MTKITALVHTFNSELYLEECLAAIACYDEILICDMYSTDRTLEIAERFGARVIFHENVGFADPARNWAVHQAKNEWVLVVDSDEIVTPELRAFIEQFLESDTTYSAVQIPVIEYFMGHTLRSSYPNHVIRLMMRDRIYWSPTVHTQPQVDGEIYMIPAARKEMALVHYSNPTVFHRIAKLNYYSGKELERKRGKSKYSSFWMTFLSAHVRFFKGYIVKGGFLDGKAGFAYSTIEFFYKFAVLFKIWEEERNKTQIDTLNKSK